MPTTRPRSPTARAARRATIPGPTPDVEDALFGPGRRELHEPGAIALEVGYESEAAFSRAFKRIVGASPDTWRRQATRAAPSST